MMEINNVKLDWESILERYITHLETEFPNLDVREKMRPIINDLNSNKLKSRVIIGSGKVAAYAFFTPAGFYSDRVYGNIGFLSEETFSQDRMSNLLKWLVSEAAVSRSLLMIDRVFNMPPLGEEIFTNMGFRLLRRIRMERRMDILVPETQAVEGFKFEGLEHLNVNAFSDAEYEAFSTVPDSVLMGKLMEERHNFTRFIFSESDIYGSINTRASRTCYFGEALAGAVIVSNQRNEASGTDPLILTVFVKKEFRNRGIARNMLLQSLHELKSQGFGVVHLYVNALSDARNLYSSLGFRESDERFTEELHYLPAAVNDP